MSLGDNVTTTNKPDTGVATYVGGNMYIGEKFDSNGQTVQYNLNHETGITGSYAAEAEGLTLVDGRLAMRQVKKSWGGQGFRFGVVGFGSQFRPADTYYDDDIGANKMPACWRCAVWTNRARASPTSPS